MQGTVRLCQSADSARREKQIYLPPIDEAAGHVLEELTLVNDMFLGWGWCGWIDTLVEYVDGDGEGDALQNDVEHSDGKSLAERVSG